MRRARPVVLTALAAILAMIPLSRSGFWGSMAVAIMGGLLVATALTILFLPALYALWFRRSLDAGGGSATSEGEARSEELPRTNTTASDRPPAGNPDAPRPEPGNMPQLAEENL